MRNAEWFEKAAQSILDTDEEVAKEIAQTRSSDRAWKLLLYTVW